MAIEIKVPVLPESIADATIITWHKKVGEFVKRDENLVDVETDKVVLEVPAPEDGVLTKIIKDVGSKVVAQELIGQFEPGAAGKTAEAPKKEEAPEKKEAQKKEEVPQKQTGQAQAGPSARRTAAEHGVDVQQVAGSGKGGRVTKADILQRTATPAGAEAQRLSPTTEFSDRPEQRVPMSRLRARIAERLLSAQHDAAILTTFNEINLKAVMELRQRYKDSFEKKHGVRLGFMSFFTKAVIEALKVFPAVNASIDDTDIIYHGYYDIGIAVSTERGLVVPIIRDADQLSMGDIEKNINDYAAKARDGKLTLEEMTGGTFTITNGGVFGSLLSTPILNPPQSGILGMHKIEERPVVENGQIVIRPMMYVAFSYDHRIIDGRESVSFLVKVKEMLEDPARLLLEI